MKRNYNLLHRQVACILLLSLFLQSCLNSTIPSDNREKGSQSYNRQVSVKEQEDDESQYIFSPQRDQQITIYQQEKKWKADVKDEIGNFTREYTLPVYFEPGMDLEKLTRLPKLVQERYLYINLSKPSMQQTEYVYIGKSGLRGGGHGPCCNCACCQIKKLNTQLDQEKKEKEKKEKENRDLKSHLDQKQKEINRLSQEKKLEREQKEEREKELDQKQREINRLSQEKESEKKKKEEKEKEFDQKQREIDRLSQEKKLEKEQKENSDLNSQLAQNQRKISQLRQQQKDRCLPQVYTCERAIVDLKANDPYNAIIDLRQQKLDKKQFKELKQVIDKNFVVGYIEWGEVPANCQKLKKKIEEKLVKNICTYTYHPNDYVHGLLANHVYNDPKEGEEVDLRALSKQVGPELPTNTNTNWKVIQVNDKSKESGFYSALYVNEDTHQAVLSFQGTKHLINDLLRADIQVLENVIGPQVEQAYAATKAAVEYIKERGFNLSITGHSLGGFLAELGVAFCCDPNNSGFSYKDVQGIVFDSPGTHEMLESFQPNVKDISTKFDIETLPITTYLSAPNLVNVCNKHVGVIYRIFPDLTGPDWYNILKKLLGGTTVKALLAIEGHLLKGVILPLFDPNTGRPKDGKYVRIASWPNLGKSDINKNKDNLSISLLKKAIGKVSSLISNSNFANFFDGINNLVKLLLNYKNINADEYWTTLQNLDDKFKKPNNLDSTGEFRLQYKAGYSEHGIHIDEYPLRKYKENQSIDKYLFKLWEKKEGIEKLKTNDIAGIVLKDILKDYTVVNLYGSPVPILKLTNKQPEIQSLRDKMQRALEILTSDRIDEILKSSESSEKKIIEALPKLYSYIAQAKLRDYIPREDKQKWLAQQLEEKGICVVYGPGGVGKSTLAVQYGWEQKKKQTVWYMPAETPEKLITSYEKLATELGINYQVLAQNLQQESNKYLAELARKVYNAIEDREQPVLLILDNATNPSLVESCLLDNPDLVQIIITTRKKKSFEHYSQIELDAFTPEEGKTYIQKTLQSPKRKLSGKDIKDLIDEVGLIPQNLALATGYLRKYNTVTIQDYIRNLQELKKRGQKKKGGLELPMVNLGLDTLELQAQQLMRYGAYLDSDFIPLSLISMLLRIDNKEELQNLLYELEELSLITVINNEDTVLGIQIHQAVQATCKEYQDWKGEKQWWWGNKLSEQALIENILKVLHDRMPDKVTRTPDMYWEQAKLYAPSVATILSNLPQERNEDSCLADLLSRMGSYSQEVICDYEQALKYFESARNIYQTLNTGDKKDRLNLALAWKNLGVIYEKLGNYQKASSSYKEALELYRILDKILDKDDPLNLANLIHSMGEVYRNLNDFSTSFDYYYQALVTYQDLYKKAKKNDPDIASNIGTIHYVLGEYEEALKYYEQALPIYQDLYQYINKGKHPNIANILNDIGMIYYKLGSIDEALKYLEPALKMRKKLYKESNHPDIASSLNNVGLAYSGLGKSQMALKYHQQAFKMYQALYTGNHPNIINSLSNIGDTYLRSSRTKDVKTRYENLNKAKEKYEQAKKVYKALYKDINEGNRQNIIMLLTNLGKIYYKLGTVQKTVENQSDGWFKFIIIKMAETLKVIDTKENAESKYQKAIEYYTKALKIRGTLIEKNKDKVPAGDRDRYEKFIRIWLRLLYDHPDIVTALNDMGMAYQALGEDQKSSNYLEQALKMSKSLNLPLKSNLKILEIDYYKAKYAKCVFRVPLNDLIKMLDLNRTERKVLEESLKSSPEKDNSTELNFEEFNNKLNELIEKRKKLDLLKQDEDVLRIIAMIVLEQYSVYYKAVKGVSSQNGI